MFRLKYQSSRLFNILTAILLSGLCLLLNELTKIDFHRLELPKDKPEFATTGIEANLFNPQGVLLYRVSAATGKQFPDSNKIVMSDIVMQGFGESDTLLHEQITSEDGWLDTKTSIGFLGESVIMTMTNPNPKQIVRVYTKDININGLTKYANSSAPVRATQGKSVLTGVGFTFDYEKKYLTIESHVKVIYESSL